MPEIIALPASDPAAGTLIPAQSADGLGHAIDSTKWLVKANNLSDLPSVSTAVSNLGLANLVKTIDVTAYGADSTGGTDATIAIQAAINALPVNTNYPLTGGGTGGSVFLPRGKYLISDTLTVPRGVTIFGESRESVVITFTPTDRDCFYVNGGSAFSPGIDTQFKNFTIFGNILGASAGAGIHVFYGSPSVEMNVNIENVYILKFYNGISIEGSASSTFKNVRCSSANQAGFVFKNTDLSSQQSNSLISCHTDNCGRAGYYLYNCNYFSFSNCTSSTDAYGYEFESCIGITCNSVSGDSNTSDGVYLNTCTSVSLVSCAFTNTIGHGVRVNAGSKHSIIGLKTGGTSSSNYGIYIVGTTSVVGICANASKSIYNNLTNLPGQIKILDLDDEINVKAFGATGDGSTDDTIAIQAALNYFLDVTSVDPVSGIRGGSVYFPRGSYLISSTLTVPRGITVHGDSRESVRILASTFTASDAFYVGPVGGTSVGSYVSFEKLTILGPIAAQTAGAGIHITGGNPVTNAQNISLKDIFVRGFYDGIKIEASVQTHLEGLRCALANQCGIRLKNDSLGSQTSTTLIACYMSNTGRAGYYFYSCGYCSLISCAADQNTIYCYELENCSRMSFISCGSEAIAFVSGDSVYLNNCTQVTFTACTFGGAGGHGIKIGGGGAHSFIGLNTQGSAASVAAGNSSIYITGVATVVGYLVNPTTNYNYVTNTPLQLHQLDTDASFADDVYAGRAKGFGFQSASGVGTRVLSNDNSTNVYLDIPSGAELNIRYTGASQVKYTNISHRHYITGIETMRMTNGGIVIQPGGVSSNISSDAALEIISSGKGFRLPSLTTSQRTGMTASDNLMVYDSNFRKPFIKAGSRWNSMGSVYASPEDYGTFDPAGVIDSTAAIQAAIDSSLPVFIPTGTFRISGLQIPDNCTIVGAGRNKSILKAYVTGRNSAIGKKSAEGSYTDYFNLQDISINGVPGSGGVGLDLNTFRYGHFSNVGLDLFRNGQTGVGVLLRSDQGNMSRNHFVDLYIGNSDTALILDTTNASYACGYNTFHGLTIDQEIDCIRMQSTIGGGVKPSYNAFYGIFIQAGSSSAAYSGTLMRLEGNGNILDGIIIDGTRTGVGYDIDFPTTTSAANRLRYLGGYVTGNIRNLQTIGAGNWIEYGAMLTHAQGKPLTFSDPLGELDIAMTAGGTNQSVEMRWGNSQSSILWRQIMQASSAPHFSIQNLSGVVTRFFDNRDILLNHPTLIDDTASFTHQHASAILELKTTGLGLLLPRLTSQQMSGISSLTSGLLIYNTTVDKLAIRTSGIWEQVTSVAF